MTPDELSPQNLLLDHSQNPRGKGNVNLAGAYRTCENPRCGDCFRVAIGSGTAYRQVSASESAPRIIWEGRGCAASTVSMSLLVSFVEGLGLDHPAAIAEPIEQACSLLMRALTRRAVLSEAELLFLGEAAALVSYASYPLKVECALLPWRCLLELVRSFGSQTV